jgi:hypothetical protein
MRTGVDNPAFWEEGERPRRARRIVVYSIVQRSGNNAFRDIKAINFKASGERFMGRDAAFFVSSELVSVCHLFTRDKLLANA